MGGAAPYIFMACISHFSPIYISPKVPKAPAASWPLGSISLMSSTGWASITSSITSCGTGRKARLHSGTEAAPVIPGQGGRCAGGPAGESKAQLLPSFWMDRTGHHAHRWVPIVAPQIVQNCACLLWWGDHIWNSRDDLSHYLIKSRRTRNMSLSLSDSCAGKTGMLKRDMEGAIPKQPQPQWNFFLIAYAFLRIFQECVVASGLLSE